MIRIINAAADAWNTIVKPQNVELFSGDYMAEASIHTRNSSCDYRNKERCIDAESREANKSNADCRMRCSQIFFFQRNVDRPFMA